MGRGGKDISFKRSRRLGARASCFSPLSCTDSDLAGEADAAARRRSKARATSKAAMVRGEEKEDAVHHGDAGEDPPACSTIESLFQGSVVERQKKIFSKMLSFFFFFLLPSLADP